MAAKVQYELPAVLERPDAFGREVDVRKAAFAEWCPALAGRRVALYGSGANARHILDVAPVCVDIVAVVDNNAIGRQLCGYEAVGLEGAFALGIDTLVIAAEFSAAFPIYRRIAQRCRRRGVALCDMYGNDLVALMRRMHEAMSDALPRQLEVLDAADVLCVSLQALRTEAEQMPLGTCIDEGRLVDNCLTALIEYKLAEGTPVAVVALEPAAARKDVEEVLASCGLLGRVSLLLAAETGLWAENGLYRVLTGQAPGARVVHIGCDVFYDCFIPLASGMDVVVLQADHPDYEFLRRYPPEGEGVTSWDAWFTSEMPMAEGAERRLAACVAQAMPGVEERYGRECAKTVAVIAPLVIGYVTWLAERLRTAAGEFDGLLFASRDAHLVYRVFEVFKECSAAALPPARYFYTSRKASAVAAAGGVEAQGALAYFAACGLEPGASYAVIEFVGAGTCQSQLEQFAPFRLTGLYFASRIGSALRRLVSCDLYFDMSDASVITRYLALEPYLSSSEPSLAGFGPDGKPIFAEELRSPSELELVAAVHEGVTEVAHSYFVGWHRPGDVIDRVFVNDIVPGLDLCDTDLVTLYNDTDGRRLTKDIWTVIPRWMPLPESGRENVAGGRVTGGQVTVTSAEDADVTDDLSPCHVSPCHAALLDLLSAFDVVCEQFGLAYIAIYGTLLGAIRNAGIIPWDDDLDVAMPRADYDMFVELAAQGVFPEAFFLQTPENTPESFIGGFARLVYSPSSADPVHMDIKPLDNCPLDDDEVERQQCRVRPWQRVLYTKTYGLDMGKLWDVNPKRLSLYVYLAEWMERDFMCRQLRRACMACKPTGMLTIFAGNYRWCRNGVRFRSSDVAAAERVPFEGTTVPVPRNAEEWLGFHYGPDWAADEHDAPAREKQQNA